MSVSLSVLHARPEVQLSAEVPQGCVEVRCLTLIVNVFNLCVCFSRPHYAALATPPPGAQSGTALGTMLYLISGNVLS